MKLLKIGDEYYNADQILRITIEKKDFARLHFGEDKTIPISKETLERIFEFTGKTEMEIEKAKIPSQVFGF